MRRAANILFVITLTIVSVCAQEPVIRVETDLITVPVTVVDRQGQSILGLKDKDFTIFEDGIKQETALFETAEVPVTVLLLLDTSSSMREFLHDLASAANVFVSQLKEKDRIIVATFADDLKIKVICPATEKKHFKRTVNLVTSNDNGFTTTFNAVDEAIKYMRSFDSRKAIVLFSDGELFGKRVSAKDNLRDAEEQDAVFYTIRFGAYPAAPTNYFRPTLEDMDRNGNALGLPPKELQKVIDRVNEYMYGLANRTGGRGFEVEKSKDLKAAFVNISAELGQQYRLGYYPTTSGKDGERRRIKVTVNEPNVAVRSRNEVIFRKTK